MKLFNITFSIFLMIALVSCAKKADVWERKDVNEVKLLSFGFYEADNPGVLERDFIVSNLNNNNILLQMPVNVDRSALIARFTVSDNDVIKAGGAIQKSGETANDFRIPVDYFLSDGNYNAKYTVTIAKGSDFIWKAIEVNVNDSATSMIMKVNPVTGMPYLMYSQNRPSSSDSRPAMAYLENEVWVNREISDGRMGSNFDFTFNSSGMPYVSFPDYNATPAQAPTVKKLDGAGWSMVGPQGLTGVKMSYNALVFVDDTKLMLTNTYDAAGGGFVRRELGYSIFENDTWTTGNKLPNRGTQATFWQAARKKNGAIYLGAVNTGSGNTISIYKYENGLWSTLLNAWRDPNATAIHTDEFDMEVDDEGTIYAAFADNSNATTQKYRVIRFDPVTNNITPLGSYLSGGSGFDLDFAISPDGIPYFLFKNENNYPAIVSFDNETQDWSIQNILEMATATDLSLDFAPNGEAYASYIKNRKLTIHKFTKP
ncbi:hypothetical protein [Pseudoflavitalea rhizosphaerae]|uniref:hypothetical protein n=1 Tax=Pseudoflavitalea rhizosphaerae TaxID=1884793 RepID=UPI000F8CEC64|nr:hypothetical protein [Pseudoflavitalea rhizosphaerae]